jgi:hypothetical protein
MRFSAIILCTTGLALAGCSAHRTTDVASESWLSGPQLESRLLPLAKDYAKQHKIDFDFTGAHCRIQIFTGGSSGASPECGDILFTHGMGKLGFEMMIDHSGKVIQAWTVVPGEGLAPPPGGSPPPNKSPEPTPIGHRSTAGAVSVTNTARLSFFR